MPEPETNGHAAAAPAFDYTLPEGAASLLAPVPETVELDTETLAFLAELDRQTALAAASLEGQRTGALAMFVRRRGLEGTWGLTDDRRGLVRRA